MHKKGRGRWLHVACIFRLALLSQEETQLEKSFFLQLMRVGCVIGFQSLLGALHETSFGFTHRDWLRCLETPRNMKEGQGWPVSATVGDLCFPVTCLLRTQQLFATEETKSQHSHHKIQISRDSVPWVCVFTDASHLILSPHCSPATAQNPESAPAADPSPL